MKIQKNSPQFIEIFTDGSCEPNPGPGGWAAVILEDGKVKEIKGFIDKSTNNRMELIAALEALKRVPAEKPVKIYTDSQYLQKGITEWINNWRKRNWKRKGGTLANADLWKALSEEADKRQIIWEWVKGHASHPFNIRADYLAHEMIVKNR